MTPGGALQTVKARSDAWKAKAVADLLRSEASESLTGETAGLSAAELRERVLALSAELTRRSKYEAVHLLEMAQEHDALWETQFAEFAAAKEEEARAAAAAAAAEELAATKRTLEEDYREEVDKARRALEETITAQANAQLRAVSRGLFERVGKETEDRLATITGLRARVGALNELLDNRQAYERASTRVHRIELAALALVSALERTQPATQEVAALRVAGAGDPVIEKAVALLPSEAHTTRGIPPVSELQVRYALGVAKAARIAAFTPTEGGMAGQIVGEAAARLPKSLRSILAEATGEDHAEEAAEVETAAAAARPAAAAPASGPASPFSRIVGPIAQSEVAKSIKESIRGDSGLKVAVTPPAIVEKALAKREAAKANVTAIRASRAEARSEHQRVTDALDYVEELVASGELEEALAYLSQLTSVSGFVRESVTDWVKDAELRVAADRATRLAVARAAVLAAALY